ncbi:MAG: YgiQ family radical SAM protein [Pseudomonadota bacterium]
MAPFDVILVLPYPFSDHPSFPEGILRKALEAKGFSVGIIETPFWQKPDSFAILGRPRLFFAIVAGPVDSVVLNYTSSRKRRREDLYQTGGKAFFDGYPPSIAYKIRPDRTTLVFANRIREMFKDVPLVIGGLEASLRVFAHYDFQQDRIRRSTLLDSRADLAVTGMGEAQVISIAQLLDGGALAGEIEIPGTARIAAQPPPSPGFVMLPSLESIAGDALKLMEAQILWERAILEGKGICQEQDGRWVIAQRPRAYSPPDLDHIYGQNYTRAHRSGMAPTPALQMNLFSITSHRGCCGGCAFCSITSHEGKRVVSRSQESILQEVERATGHPAWKGVMSDIGGPSAEMYGMDCEQNDCQKPSCLDPGLCPHLSPVTPFLELLRACRKVRAVKKVFLGSGIRYDLFLQHPELLEEIMVHHSGGFLRIAPEHTEDEILPLMRKPSFETLERFVRLFRSINKGLDRKIQLAPYLIVGHPGERWDHVESMAGKLKSLVLRTKDVQIFTPTPGTLSTAMFYSRSAPGLGPLEVEKDIKSLLRRKALLTDL